MADLLQFEVILPPASAPDVAVRNVTIDINGNVNTLTLEHDVNRIENLEGEQGATVTITLVDVDDTDNESEPSVKTVVLVDTIAPPKPGEIGLTVVNETFKPDTSSEG